MVWQMVLDARKYPSVSLSSDKATTKLGLEASHYYTLLGGDKSTNTVKMRNPWGHVANVDPSTGLLTTYGKSVTIFDDGVFIIDFNDWISTFINVKSNPIST